MPGTPTNGAKPGVFGLPTDSKLTSAIHEDPFPQSACRRSTTPLLDSVSLTSGDHVPTYWILAWPIGASWAVIVPELKGPAKANVLYGVITDSQMLTPPNVGLLYVICGMKSV